MADKSIGTKSFATSSIKRVTKRLRWAFIGTGGISGTHIGAIRQIPEIEIVAGCDIKPDRQVWFKQQPGCQNASTYTDYKEMLKKEKIDVVDVCTPNGVHCPAAIAALQAGCHVIVEKPMAMDPAECAKMCAAAKKAKKALVCGFQQRYNSNTEMCVRAREAGLLGDIMFVKVHALRRRGIPNWGVFGQKKLQGGGPMIDIGVHMIESAHYAMGEPNPIAASGMTWTYMGDQPSQVVCPWPNWDYKTYTVEDLAVGQVRFDNGAIMQIESSFCAHIEKEIHYWEIMGTKGGFNSLNSTLYTDMAGTMLNAQAGFLPDTGWDGVFVRKIQNLVDHILRKTPLRAPGEEGMKVQKIIDGIYRSAAKKGAEVKIN